MVARNILENTYEELQAIEWDDQVSTMFAIADDALAEEQDSLDRE